MYCERSSHLPGMLRLVLYNHDHHMRREWTLYGATYILGIVVLPSYCCVLCVRYLLCLRLLPLSPATFPLPRSPTPFSSWYSFIRHSSTVSYVFFFTFYFSGKIVPVGVILSFRRIARCDHHSSRVQYQVPGVPGKYTYSSCTCSE